MSSHKGNKNAYSSMNNLIYGLRRLYRISPIFIWIYFLGIPLAIGISLLGVYMPSVLVADITAGARISVALKSMAHITNYWRRKVSMKSFGLRRRNTMHSRLAGYAEAV